jgi:LPXTG-site transpeptidase (sortase) family protein
MNVKQIPPIPYFFYAVGVILLVAGLSVWWYQNHAIVALDDPTGRVGLAVVATQAPPTPTATFAPTSTPNVTATPAITDSAVAQTPALSPTATETPLPSPTATATPDPFPSSVSAPTRLVIPKLSVDSPVVTMMWEYKEDANGSVFTEWAVPLNEVGWHINSTTPGNHNNVVMSGHNNIGSEVFSALELLEPGDEAQVYVGDQEYRYVVEEKYILREEGMPLDVRIQNNTYILPTEDERLTLVSCWPYETNSHRIVIIARPKIG